VVGTSWHALALAAVFGLPAVAALGTSHGRAELPVLPPFVLTQEATAHLLAAGLLHHPPLAPPLAPAAASKPDVFSPAVARWRPVVEEELAGLRAARELHPAVTPELVLAVIEVESRGDPAARSPARALGLMQVLPTTLASVLPDGHRADPFDPPTNVRAGILYLDQALRFHGGDLTWGLAAYNAGIAGSARARRGDGRLVNESAEFVSRVLATLPAR
jgi:soluble lytic murein transglycosylase-like protein